ADRNRSHWSTSKTPSYTKSVSWQHHLTLGMLSCVSDIPCDDNFYDVLSIPVASGNNMQCKNNPRCTHL
ncbi:hypothetical protein ACQSJH_016050, partial [Escherichia coli]